MPADAPAPGVAARRAYALWPVTDGLRMLAREDPKEMISLHLSSGELVCPASLLAALRASAAANVTETLLDVGSNIGSCAVAALRLGHAVVALEPAPENVRLWRANAGGVNAPLFPRGARAFLLPFAAADAASAATMRHDVRNVGNAMVEPEQPQMRLGQANPASGGRETVCALTLDGVAAGTEPAFADLRAALKAVTLVKIDVQGHEVKALRGMAGVLRDARNARAVFVEVSPGVAALKGDDPREVLDILAAAGFRVIDVDVDALKASMMSIVDNLSSFVDLEAVRDVPPRA
jgi:FkbM family methyltransferase